MAIYRIKKTSSGYAYFVCGTYWRQFPPDCQTRDAMIQYFEEGRNFANNDGRGRFDTPILQFVNASGKPIKNYTVKREGKYIKAMEEGDKLKTILIYETELFPVAEQIQLLKELADRETEAGLREFDGDKAKLEYLKDNATPEALNALNEAMREKLSDAEIKKFCTAHAEKHYQLPAEVEFI